MFIGFGPWRPDLPDDKTGVTDALNVLPAFGSYEPMRGLSPLYQALDGRCIGAFSCRSSFGETFWFAGTADSLFAKLSGIDEWVRLVRILAAGADGFSSTTGFGNITICVAQGLSEHMTVSRITMIPVAEITSGVNVNIGFGSVPLIIPDES